MTTVGLGRLEAVPPRTVWTHEAGDFTPWLLDNGDRLADALGIELELTAREHAVGLFAVDLIGRDLTNDAVLLVENQLESTDHGHLGQLLTYAAGTDAATIVWIATTFREEHRQALDWLNQQTSEDTRFFGIELQVVRIGDSAPAPLFRLLAQPNDWQKHVRTVARAERTGGKSEAYHAFWTRYLERVHAEHPDWTRARVPSRDNWMDQTCGWRGAHFSVNFARGRLRHELYVDSPDPEQVTAVYDHLNAHRDVLEQRYGRALSWEPLPNRRASRIADYYEEADVTETDRHDEFIDWFFDAGQRMREALAAIPPPPDTTTGATG